MSEHTFKPALWIRCLGFVDSQSAGEWGDKQIADDADLLMEFVRAELKAAHEANEAKTEALVKALEWYAQDYNHELGCSQWDGGAKARSALALASKGKA